MSDFLHRMAQSSLRRAQAAAQNEPLAALIKRCEGLPDTIPLVPANNGMSVIAEIKLQSPAEGRLSGTNSDAALTARAQCYIDAGACAISVLTEPDRFAGALHHLAPVAACAHPAKVAVMRKDFLTDIYQVYEARAAGADGVLLIKRLLADKVLSNMLSAAQDLGMFVLLEAFDQHDLEQCDRYVADNVLIGLNCRDLTTLQIDPARCAELIGHFPAHAIKVAESGIHSAADARALANQGYHMALIGTALMKANDPAALIAQIRQQTVRSSR
ncbi:MAG: indole-3-glycerol-phosphate synthase [Gammaproteobacteria bacterium]|nr:indole-3-glycerol-phosphate synthase [Gammaproteobacteria bacterium]